MYVLYMCDLHRQVMLLCESIIFEAFPSSPPLYLSFEHFAGTLEFYYPNTGIVLSNCVVGECGTKADFRAASAQAMYAHTH